MPAQVLIGAASWTDKPLVQSGRFYPPEAKTPEARLRYYASQFPLVEVDSTYYALPSEENSRKWVERTPDDFVLDVKAYALFTDHPAPIKRLPEAARPALPKDLAAKGGCG